MTNSSTRVGDSPDNCAVMDVAHSTAALLGQASWLVETANLERLLQLLDLPARLSNPSDTKCSSLGVRTDFEKFSIN